jgi:hypothetical protein
MGMKNFSQVEINGNEGLLTFGNEWNEGLLTGGNKWE